MAQPTDRDILRQLFGAALRKVQGSRCVGDFLAANKVVGKVHMAAVGKASESMARGAMQSLGGQLVRGLVITKRGARSGPPPAGPRLTVLESAHPVPDQSSLDAGVALVDFVASVPSDDLLLLLVSGGASSLVEVPAEGIGLPDVQRLNRYLLGSGLDIHRCNALRISISRIKGGGLLKYFPGRDCLCLLISDVSTDDPSVIGSGLAFPKGPDRCVDDVPQWVADMAARGTAHAGMPAAASPRIHILASNTDALRAACDRAKELGLAPAQPAGILSGDAAHYGRAIGRQLRQAVPGLYLWGGETTVRLPPHPGRGGRNQHLALALAGELRPTDRISVLVSGTDGNDGEGSWSGAMVDGGTRNRGESAGADLERCLVEADSGRFLEASGDLFATGPTGTNVCDLVIALVRSSPVHLG